MTKFHVFLDSAQCIWWAGMAIKRLFHWALGAYLQSEYMAQTLHLYLTDQKPLYPYGSSTSY